MAFFLPLASSVAISNGPMGVVITIDPFSGVFFLSMEWTRRFVKHVGLEIATPRQLKEATGALFMGRQELHSLRCLFIER